MTARHTFDPTVLREYDVRGIVGTTLGEADALALGAAFGTCVAEAGGRTVAVGYDGRDSSPGFAAAVVKGLTSCGLTAVRVGRGPSPMTYFAAKTLPTDAALMITGSHNPPDYNGFKMSIRGAAFFGEDIQRLGRIAAEAAYATGEGAVEDRDVRVAYADRLVEEYRGDGGLKIAWDPGNGAASEIVAYVCSRLPGRHYVINGTIDGSFPNHHPDPTVAENLEQLQDVVARHGCDLGVAFDGDGDRVGAIDGQGRIVYADQLMLIFAHEVLAERKGAPIVADVKCSQVLFDEIVRAGGEPVMWKTGHSLTKTKMQELDAPLAGEMSGHIFFGDRYYGFDDAVYAAVRLISLVATGGRTLDQIHDALPRVVNTPELRFTVDEARKFAIVEEIRGRLQADGADLNALDGVRVKSGDGWWLLRASNTQDVLTARCEALSDAGLVTLKGELAGQLRLSGVEPPAELD